MPALIPADRKGRLFWVALAALLLLTALYTGLAAGAWASTPLGQHPEGEAAAWLADAEQFHSGELTREPFFRAPAYLTILATLRFGGVSAAGLPGAARAVNGFAHVASTALVVVLGLQFWRRKGALLAGALWGFYPPAVFMTLQPGPASLALLAWAVGAAAALGTVWLSPIWQGGRITRQHAWACPATAGIAFALAASLYAPFWPVALAWPFIALLMGRDLRTTRFLASLAGVALVVLGTMGLQTVWGGSPQPLAGEDLYRLSRSLEITLPWNAPVPAVEFSSTSATRDDLEAEARLVFESRYHQPAPSHAVLDGFWWRSAWREVWFSPSRSLLRGARKFSQFFAQPNYSAGADYTRAKAELPWLHYNPLSWGVLLVLGLAGLALRWRQTGAGWAVLLAVMVGAGAVIWYPTMEARAPVAFLLALFAGAWPALPWSRWRQNRGWVLVAIMGAIALAWWPRRDSPADILAMRDSRERASACAALGHFDDALAELTRSERTTPLSLFEREMAAHWRFAQLLNTLPAGPPNAILETELLDNGDLAHDSPAAQFRAGACLWLLGHPDGALYYWDKLSSDQGAWGAAARQALALSGQETPAQATRRAAWEIGGSPQPDPALAPFFARIRWDAAHRAGPAIN